MSDQFDTMFNIPTYQSWRNRICGRPMLITEGFSGICSTAERRSDWYSRLLTIEDRRRQLTGDLSRHGLPAIEGK
jgi:hypothetical protein